MIESYFDWGKEVGFAQIVHPLNQQGITELIPLHGMLSVLERGEARDGKGEQRSEGRKTEGSKFWGDSGTGNSSAHPELVLMPSACRSVPGPGFVCPLSLTAAWAGKHLHRLFSTLSSRFAPQRSVWLLPIL